EKDGGTYNYTNNKCYKTVSVQKNANIEYYCTNDTTLNGNKCQKYYETDAPYTLTCPKGYTLNGNYCEK
ncbi:MAG: hypothetical protein SOZ04_05630, partial [Bacilli bacterium]|nr:hypothetical protein [Bacilli bacterium]